MPFAKISRGSTLLLLILWVERFVLSSCQAINGDGFPDDGGVTTFSEPSTTIPPPPYSEPGGDYGDPSVHLEARRGPNGLEILVAIFFFVAAAWLLIAVFYALLALIVLRLRARGRLDIYDEEFGRLYLYGTRFYIPCGCILRRYVVAFGHDQPNSRSRSSEYRYISRSERRRAMAKLLLGTGKNKPYTRKETTETDEEMGSPSESSAESRKNPPRAEDDAEDTSLPDNADHSQSSEEPMCSICLAEYGKKRLSRRETVSWTDDD